VRFRRLAHTADVRLVVWGGDQEELLRNAVSGALTCALGRSPRGSPEAWRVVAPWPEDLAGRLVRAVNEALFLLYSRREVAVGLRLRAERSALGVVPLPRHLAPGVEVKAATFHDLAVVRHPRLRATLTLDL
jgi:SHS2 domain-containing protein